MPRYLFHLSDEEDTFIDDTGKELEDGRAAHAHGLGIIEQVRRFVPGAENSTWKVRITQLSSHPDSCSRKFDEGEVVCGVLLVAGCDCPEVLELVEEAFDEVPGAVEERAEGRLVAPTGEWLDVGPHASRRHRLAEEIAVVGAVCDQDLAGSEVAQQVGGAAAVVSLPFGELEDDRQAVGIDEGVDLRRQSASRAPHALGSRLVPSGGRRRGGPPFLALPPCW